MGDWINAVGGVLLLCVPASMWLTVFYAPTYKRENGDMSVEIFFLLWFLAYWAMLLFAAVGFAGVVGVVMLTGAFQ